jgi:hypothetical protein
VLSQHDAKNWNCAHYEALATAEREAAERRGQHKRR